MAAISGAVTPVVDKPKFADALAADAEKKIA
jgi:hypothetical protein